MGCKMGGDDPAKESSTPPSPSDALLFTTMCIIGLPVEVQVKDGSVFSGIFHTVCFEMGYGIILKKARKIGKGKCDTNLAMGALVDTLVVLSRDLVQVVVKEFVLPAEGIIGNVGGRSASGSIQSRACNEDPKREPKAMVFDHASPTRGLDKSGEKACLYGSNMNDDAKVNGLDEKKALASPSENMQEVEDGKQDSICPEKIEEPSLFAIVSDQERQVREERLQGEEDPCNHVDGVFAAKPMVPEFQYSSPMDACIPQISSYDENHVDISSNMFIDGARCGSPASMPVRQDAPESKFSASTNLLSSDAWTSTASSSPTLVPDFNSSSYPSQAVSPNLQVTRENSGCNTNAKEFKLNPGAKIFSPSFANSRPVHTTVSNVASAAYVSNDPPIMPIAQPGIEISSFASHSSLPTKFVQFNNLVAGHGGVGVQYARPIVGHAGTRQQPVRFSGQYHPVQAAPAFVQPNSQTVMVGRVGQLVYVHPISQDSIQRTPSLSQGLPHHLLTPYQANVPKLQGSAAQSVQLCLNPPLITAGNQPFAVPSHIPFSQTFPAIRPIQVPGGNGVYGSKFQ